MALYLTKADPLMILRDLLGHSSVTTTELYLSKLDTTRVFREVYEYADNRARPADDILSELDEEFDELADDLVVP